MNLDENTEAAAITWFARLRSSEAGSAEKAEFERWLAASPAHPKAYEKAAALWEFAGKVSEHPAILAERSAILAKTSSPVVSRRTFMAVAAAAAVAFLVVSSSFFSSTEESFSTAFGEQKSVVLPDGSTATLDTDTRLRVNFSGRARRVTLEKGQAFFSVAHQPERPFAVAAGNGVVTALGTVFSVRRDQQTITVTLVTGKVAVDVRNGDVEHFPTGSGSVSLLSNQQVSYTAHEIKGVQPIDAAAAVSWVQGDIIFHDTLLKDAVSEINRYTKTKIVVRDSRLEALRINGVFHVTDVETFLLALNATFGIRTLEPRSIDEIVLVK